MSHQKLAGNVLAAIRMQDVVRAETQRRVASGLEEMCWKATASRTSPTATRSEGFARDAFLFNGYRDKSALNTQGKHEALY